MDKSPSEIQLPSVDDTNHRFIEVIKSTLSQAVEFDITSTETKVLCKILPAVQCRFDQIFSENCSLFETTNDEMVYDTIRENLETVYQLIEIIQELLNIINQKSPTQPTHIESLLKCLPLYIHHIAKHWDSSSDSYKNAFIEPLSNIFEVAKHLYASFLVFLEQSLLIEDDTSDIALIGVTLLSLCEMPKIWSVIDPSSIISSWKCFITVATKHSLLSDCYFDVSTCIRLLSDDICRVLELLSDEEPKLFSRQLKICIILVKVLSKICIEACDQILKECCFDLLVSFTKIFSYSPEYYKNINLSDESITTFENEVVQVLDDFLRHLLLVQKNIFKEELKSYTNKLDSLGLLQKLSWGTLSLFDKVFYSICNITSDWSEVLVMLINGTFHLITYCHKQLFSPSYKGGIYHRLIVNLTAAILTQDCQLNSFNVLLKHLFQDDLFGNFLALEVLSLISCNIDSNENLILLLNLLYSVNELSSGFFTCRPEIVWLKCLLQRLFSKLSDLHKEQIIRMFPLEENIEVWRVLGFQHLSPTQVRPLVEPIVSMTVECIRSFNQQVNEEDIVNIGESIKLISSCITLQLPNISEYVAFVEKFWLLNLDQELLQNNLIKYLTFATFIFAVNSLSPDLIISKLKTLLQNKSYWIVTFEASFLMLCKAAQHSNSAFFREMGGLLQKSIKTDLLLRELQFEMLNTLNHSQPDTLNQLLDASDPSIANQIFEYIDSFRKNSKTYQLNCTDKTTGFTHKCIQWRECIGIEAPPTKKFKFSELPNLKENNQPPNNFTHVKETQKRQIKKVSNKKKSPPEDLLGNTEVEDSLMGEAIETLKGEVKCLIKLKKTEKLTPKNAADLRIIISQLSSLM